MQCGLYGKVPAKRDFIAIAAPREFLRVWEPWLQGAMSASRATLGDGWQPAFLTAPIWRFWLGADICGRNMTGAFMPSLDGVGRYFPLTLFSCAEDGATIPPPEYGAQDGWFDVAEAFLTSALDDDAQFETMTTTLRTLPPPSQEILSGPAAGSVERSETHHGPRRSETPLMGFATLNPSYGDAEIVKKVTTNDVTVSAPAGSDCGVNGIWAQRADGQGFGELFNSIRAHEYARIYAGSTFWWTIGGEDFMPVALSVKGMPDPFLFSAMLTGKFAACSA